MVEPLTGGPETPVYFNFATDVMDRWAQTRPEALALWCVQAETGRQQHLNFRELAALSRQAASLFHTLGVQHGDRVLLMLPRISQWWVALLGLIRLGAVPVPAASQLTARETAHRLATANVKAVISDSDNTGKFSDYAGIRLQVNGSTAGWTDFDAGILDANPDFTREPTRSDDPGILYFTSATTGHPKMVLHTQASYGLGHRLTGQCWLDLRPTDVHWNLSDLGWGKAAWSSFFGPWQMGACVFALDYRTKFNPGLALRTLAQYPITTWCAPPTALRLVVREDLGHWRFPHLRHCVTAGEPLNPEVMNRWKAATGLTLYEAYGQTETVVLIGNFRSLGDPVRPGSMGKPAPGFHLALLDDNLAEVPNGTEGEIAVRVKPSRPLGLFQEYWLDPEETARQFRGDWYLTGDRAVRDDHGYFWFVGRKDDVIKCSGYRIGPFEVESTLLEHPAVLEAAIVGKPDDVRGQIVKAFVVLRSSFRPSATLACELQDHCRRIAAPYKYPREIEFVDELPKTVSGKIRRVDLRRQAFTTTSLPSK
jgi:acetyl-CoA synthetase/medium-chain acyl-CoA synthetase